VPQRKTRTPEGRSPLCTLWRNKVGNAVDSLHWDIIASVFTDVQNAISVSMTTWVRAAMEESQDFNLMCDCLEAAGQPLRRPGRPCRMWRAAERLGGCSSGSACGWCRWLEARGRDCTPGIFKIFKQANGIRRAAWR